MPVPLYADGGLNCFLEFLNRSRERKDIRYGTENRVCVVKKWPNNASQTATSGRPESSSPGPSISVTERDGSSFAGLLKGMFDCVRENVKEVHLHSELQTTKAV